MPACYTQRSRHAHLGPLHRTRGFPPRIPRTRGLHVRAFCAAAGAVDGTVCAPHRFRRTGPKALRLHFPERVCVHCADGHADRRAARTGADVGGQRNHRADGAGDRAKEDSFSRGCVGTDRGAADTDDDCVGGTRGAAHPECDQSGSGQLANLISGAAAGIRRAIPEDGAVRE